MAARPTGTPTTSAARAARSSRGTRRARSRPGWTRARPRSGESVEWVCVRVCARVLCAPKNPNQTPFNPPSLSPSRLSATHAILPPDAWLPILDSLSSLTELNLTGDTARSVPWRALPRGLAALKVTDCEGSLNAEAHLAHLPPSLTSLHLLAAGAPDGHGLLRSGRPFLAGFPTPALALTQLKDLALASRGVRALPPDIAALSFLTRLSVRHAGMVTLPSELGDLPRLASLDLAGNKLLRSRGARAALAPLPRLARTLTSLVLSSNASRADDTELPGCVLGTLTRLVELRAAHNTRLAVPGALSKLTALSLLDLRACDLHDYPPALAALRGVATLLLGGNRRIAAGGLPCSNALADLEAMMAASPTASSSSSSPVASSPSPRLTRCCSDCSDSAGAAALTAAVSALAAAPSTPPTGGFTPRARAPPPTPATAAASPPSTPPTGRPPLRPPLRTAVGQLVRVRELDLSRAGLAALPPSAAALTALTSLRVCGASSYPGVGFDWPSLAHASSLRLLDVSGSYMEELPAVLADLPALRLLRACECGLVRVGARVAASMTALTSIALDGNRLALLPAAELASMPRLETASLVDNVAMQLPADLAALARACSLTRLDARKHARGVGGRVPPWSTTSLWRLARAYPALAEAAPGRDWSAVLLL